MHGKQGCSTRAAKHGYPETIVSANRSNFTASTNYLHQFHNKSISQAYFNNRNLEWKFIRLLTSWENGFYERMVGVVKSYLRKAMYGKCLNFNEIITTFIRGGNQGQQQSIDLFQRGS